MDEDFRRLLKYIENARGFNTSAYEKNHLERRLGIRIKATNAGGYAEYLRILREDEEELDRLVKILTVNVTQFFRNPGCFRIIGKELLPQIFARKGEQGKRTVKVWSAGCSTGEEPYTIAIMARELLGERLGKFLVFITGTDIDEDALERARKGEYDRKNLGEVPKAIMKKYFREAGESGKLLLSEEARAMVRFRKHDITCGPGAGLYDLILCRNVLIYLDRETQAEAIEKFHRALGRGGFLVLGNAEVMPARLMGKFSVVSNAERIFRKKA